MMVMQSSRAPVSRLEPKISVHTLKCRLPMIIVVSVVDALERQLGVGLRLRHIAELVADEQILGSPLLLEEPHLFFVMCLDQFANRGGGGEEADVVAALASGGAEHQSNVMWVLPVPLLLSSKNVLLRSRYSE